MSCVRNSPMMMMMGEDPDETSYLPLVCLIDFGPINSLTNLLETKQL